MLLKLHLLHQTSLSHLLQLTVLSGALTDLLALADHPPPVDRLPPMDHLSDPLVVHQL